MEATRIRLEQSLSNPSAIGVAAPQVSNHSASSSSSAPKRRGNGWGWGRLVRWLIGGAMVAEAVYLLAPSVLYRTSVRASVTSPMATVRVHRPGVVEGIPPEVGSTISPGQVLFEVVQISPDLRPSEQARAEAESIRRASDAIRAQIEALDAKKASLREHFEQYREARIARSEAQLDEQTARVEEAEDRLKEAEYERQVEQQLLNRKAGSEIMVVRAEYALEVARDELEAARRAERRFRLQLDAARRGVFVGEADGGQDRPSSLQRCDEIDIQQVALRARIGELDGKLQELEARLESERKHLAEGRFPVVSPMGGMVWSSSLAPGVEVFPGETALEVVDPDRLGIEALFKEGDATRIRPGASVQARLVGSSRILRGRVVRVTDPVAADPETIGEVSRDAVPPGTFRAVIELQDQPEGGDEANRHHIGTPAVVWAAR